MKYAFFPNHSETNPTPKHFFFLYLKSESHARFSRAWHRLYVFPPLAPTEHFPAVVSVACFPALDTSFHWVVIGSLPFIRLLWLADCDYSSFLVWNYSKLVKHNTVTFILARALKSPSSDYKSLGFIKQFWFFRVSLPSVFSSRRAGRPDTASLGLINQAKFVVLCLWTKSLNVAIYADESFWAVHFFLRPDCYAAQSGFNFWCL